MRAIIAIAFVLGLTAVAHAHSWYPPLCCNGSEEGGDCHPVPCDSIAETRTGYVWQGHEFQAFQIHPSFDRNCHVCVSHYTDPDRDVPHCVFIQPSS